MLSDAFAEEKEGHQEGFSYIMMDIKMNVLLCG